MGNKNDWDKCLYQNTNKFVKQKKLRKIKGLIDWSYSDVMLPFKKLCLENISKGI